MVAHLGLRYQGSKLWFVIWEGMPINIGTVAFPTRKELQREGFTSKAEVTHLLSARQVIEIKSLNLSF